MSASTPDFVVVGAGAAGGVVAKELATAGFRVVVLEQGPWLRERDFRHDELWALQQHALTNDHRRQPNTRRESEAATATLRPTITYGRMVGGGSVHFTANYWRFHEIDFVERSRKGPVTGTGLDDWPISYAELEPYYAKAEWELGVSGQAGPADPPRSRPYPLPPLPPKPTGVLAERGGQAARLDRVSVPDGHSVTALPGPGSVRPVRVLRELRLRDAGEEQHARDRDPGGAPDRPLRDPAGELRARDRGRPAWAGDGRGLFRPPGQGAAAARAGGRRLRQRRGDARASC